MSGKYDKYIINPDISRFTVADDGRQIFHGIFLFPEDTGCGVRMGHQIITKDMISDNPAHYHNHHEFLMWLGTNPDDPTDFGAEVHFFFGEELEEHVFTKPTLVVLPPNLVHCPLEVVNVTKPIIQIEVMLPTEDGSESSRVPFFPEEKDYYEEHQMIIETFPQE